MYKRRRQILGCHRLATPTELRRAGKTRTDARLKKHGCRRYATWAGQVVSTLERHTVVVAGADAAGTALPHLARPSDTEAHLAPYTPLTPVTRTSGSSIKGKVRLPQRQQEAQAHHGPPRLHLPSLRPRLPDLLPTRTRPGQSALDQTVLALTHRQLTHRTGALLQEPDSGYRK